MPRDNQASIVASGLVCPPEVFAEPKGAVDFFEAPSMDDQELQYRAGDVPEVGAANFFELPEAPFGKSRL